MVIIYISLYIIKRFIVAQITHRSLHRKNAVKMEETITKYTILGTILIMVDVIGDIKQKAEILLVSLLKRLLQLYFEN